MVGYYNAEFGLPLFKAEAAKRAQACSASGDKFCHFYLAILFRDGDGGLKKDLKRFFQLFEKSAEQGFTRAYNDLAHAYERGFGVRKSDKKVFELFRKSAG